MILTNHFQNAYVTADIDRAVDVMTQQFGGPAKPGRIDATQNFVTSEGEGEGILRLAFLQVGGLQYELIQPVSGNVALYADAIRPDRLLTFHHVAMRADDIDAALAESVRWGRSVAMHGESRGLRFAYVDARTTLGHYLEYVSAPEAFWDSLKPRS